MLTKKIETALNDQVLKEAAASSSYLSMASWCETQGLNGSAAFFYAQSQEEREHMIKVFKYINQSQGHAFVPAIKEPPASYKSIEDVFKTSLKYEEDVTKSINKLVELSFNSKDYATFNFLQWFVAEQREEELLFHSILDVIHLFGTKGRDLFLVDKEIAKIRNKE